MLFRNAVFATHFNETERFQVKLKLFYFWWYFLNRLTISKTHDKTYNSSQKLKVSTKPKPKMLGIGMICRHDVNTKYKENGTFLVQSNHYALFKL